MLLHQLRQANHILNRHASPLGQGLQRGVGRIAQQANTSIVPVALGLAVGNGPAPLKMDQARHLLRLGLRLCQQVLQVCLVPLVLGGRQIRRHTHHQHDVEQAGLSQGVVNHVQARPCPHGHTLSLLHLGRGLVHRDQAAVGHITRFTRDILRMHLGAQTRAQSVTRHHGSGLDGLALRRLQAHCFTGLGVAGDGGGLIERNMRVLFTSFEQQLVHVHAMDGDIRLRLVALRKLRGLQRDVRQRLPGEVVIKHDLCGEISRSANFCPNPQFVQHRHDIGAHLHAISNGPNLIGLLQQLDPMPLAPQGQGHGHTANATAHHHHGVLLGQTRWHKTPSITGNDCIALDERRITFSFLFHGGGQSRQRIHFTHQAL